MATWRVAAGDDVARVDARRPSDPTQRDAPVGEPVGHGVRPAVKAAVVPFTPTIPRPARKRQCSSKVMPLRTDRHGPPWNSTIAGSRSPRRDAPDEPRVPAPEPGFLYRDQRAAGTRRPRSGL